PGLEELPRRRLGIERGDVLAGQAHELPAPASGPARHDGRRPGRIADLTVDRLPDPGFPGHDVDDEPVEEETEVGRGEPQSAAQEAVGAVAADDVAGAYLPPVAVGRRRDECDVLAAGLDIDDLAGALDIHAGERTRPSVECALEIWLREHVGLGPAREA